MEKTARQTQKITALLTGLVAAYAVTGGLLLLLALLLFKLDLTEGKITAGIIIIYILSCFLGGLIAGKRAGSRKFLWGLLLGLIYVLLLMAVSAFTGPGISSGAPSVITSFIMCMGAGMMGGMLS